MEADLRVTVEFMGPFEFDFGVTSTEVTLPPPATIGTLVDALAARWPAARRLRTALARPFSRRRYYYVSVDYVQVPLESTLDTPLHDGARVCFGTPMVGG